MENDTRCVIICCLLYWFVFFALNVKILLYLHTFSYENNEVNAFVEKVGSTETNEKNRTTYMLDIKRRAYPWC